MNGRPETSDTFFLILDPAGSLVSNPSGVPRQGLPDESAVAAARATGRDLRTVDGRHGPDPPPHASDRPSGQARSAGFRAGSCSRSMIARRAASSSTVTLVGLVGLAGAALVTLFVTGRALVPIRAAFATERRFVADASHEIRTPAAIIRASAEVLEREGLVAEDGHALVADIVAESDRLGGLVDDLLALAASERGSLAIARRHIDLADGGPRHRSPGGPARRRARHRPGRAGRRWDPPARGRRPGPTRTAAAGSRGQRVPPFAAGWPRHGHGRGGGAARRVGLRRRPGARGSARSPGSDLRAVCPVARLTLSCRCGQRPGPGDRAPHRGASWRDAGGDGRARGRGALRPILAGGQGGRARHGRNGNRHPSRYWSTRRSRTPGSGDRWRGGWACRPVVLAGDRLGGEATRGGPARTGDAQPSRRCQARSP